MALQFQYENRPAATLGINNVSLNPENTFGALTTDRPGFTFNPDLMSLDLTMPTVSTPSQLLPTVGDTLLYLNSLSGRGTMLSGGNTGAVNNLLAAYGDNIAGLKARADQQMATGGVLKTAASAVKVFDQLLTWDLRRDNINLQRDNTKQAADNQMLAIDNQVSYVKNQLMDKFNQLVANNTVMMAAKNLRVTAANVLEASKETAHDLEMDFRTAESNAELEKINLRNAKKQADISAKIQKTKQMTDFIGSAANLGLNLATGGGTGMSWGNLYNNFMQY